VSTKTKLEDLRSALRNVHMVIGIEKRRLGSATMAQSQLAPAIQLQGPQAEPPKSLSEVRKMVGRR
jgi:hypothetical protein